MNRRIIILINAAYYGALYIGYLIAPRTLLTLFYLPDPGEVGPILARAGGALGVGLALMIWSVRNTEDSSVQRAALIALLLADVVNLLLTLAGVLAGVGPAVLWWPAVVIFSIFTLSVAYLLLVKPRP